MLGLAAILGTLAVLSALLWFADVAEHWLGDRELPPEPVVAPMAGAPRVAAPGVAAPGVAVPRVVAPKVAAQPDGRTRAA